VSFRFLSDVNTSADGNDARKVIEYWNSARLCSREASTSHADPDLAWLDNLVELSVLEQRVQGWGLRRGRVLDIGAGYGRFTPLFLKIASEVILLEAADSIYHTLAETWGSQARVACCHTDFETYYDDQPFSLVFTSGVLYFYSDEMLRRFLAKAVVMLVGGGLLVIRDFVSAPQVCVKESAYVKGAHCYYRTSDFWRKAATSHGMELLEITRSKPRCSWVRDSRILRLMGLLHLRRYLRSRPAASLMRTLGSLRLGSTGIQTVFIAMKKP